ncbi:MAG: tetratricopeptide repeat protein [Candidatus Riflebacteria bacterium]|nr:tetratricopeptide repeat protein [Candidatus Riflebacteria bacterium]
MGWLQKIKSHDEGSLRDISLILFLATCILFFRGIPVPEPPTSEELTETAFGHLLINNVYAAWNLYIQAYKLDPGNMAALRGLAVSSCLREKPEDAFYCYRILASRNNQKIESADLMDVGILFEKQKRFSEAEEFYKFALTVLPDLYAANYRLAKAQFEQGRVEQAISTLETLLPRMPEGFEKQQAQGGIIFMRDILQKKKNK